MKPINYPYFFISLILVAACNDVRIETSSIENNLPENILDYSGTPTSAGYRSSLAFSDQGAWFAFGFPTDPTYFGGFSGPFLMTQENGVWCSPSLSRLELRNISSGEIIDWDFLKVHQKSYNSHLEQTFENENLRIFQTLFYSSPHTALIKTEITNVSDQKMKLQVSWSGKSFLKSLHFEKQNNLVAIYSDKSTAQGFIQVLNDEIDVIEVSDSAFSISMKDFELKANNKRGLILAQTFIFPEYTFEVEKQKTSIIAEGYDTHLQSRINEKEKQLNVLNKKLDSNWLDPVYNNLVAKSVLTLQNNWRVPAGELKHSGLFPSYHYEWFHGFWAWDSWKHAVALAQFNTDLAKEQIKAMYDFQEDDGFIPDCIYRDTTIENHNYRNTKPPLSAWAVCEVYRRKMDLGFIKELYPKIIKQHRWWYQNRDHDNDGICEYGSTDGSLIAAKWESGMDNAVRFDESQILKNSETSYSMNQESVDLNSYLYAEKKYLIELAKILKKADDVKILETEAEDLKTKIQNQFFDPGTGWFYDTSLDGKEFIKVMGCEGWVPLWAEVATPGQAEKIKNTMMDPDHFFTQVPFQTLSASHRKFKPDGGYWRGPNWLDQAYFGVIGLRNYGYSREANDATYRLIHNAEGVLTKGESIRENYNPITGEGLESENFSWSAAHYLLLLLDNND